MLQIHHICKEYHTGNLVQKALDDVSLNLRDNEFVAVLGPSGSGKTTLLNIIGGLDQYDSGELIINGISTKEYQDRDWDSYRNHTIGFVFQSYNLIPHQTLLSNVELALTISGVGRAQRRERARKALEQVGLGDQVDKKPNQLSGGQMQRVAIARALVNNPDILLADEPTGALDTDTSKQVMDLLKEVAKDRLVVMVTHNPELAEEYATRIVRLRDGRIVSDSDPCPVDEEAALPVSHENMGKAYMSLPTAISLSFNNLLTKKARTILTAFAGSIGIIGIALILSLSTGVNQYIADIEEETLSGYPLQISSTGFDWTSLFSDNGFISGSDDEEEADIRIVQMITSLFSTMDSNDLASLKEYLDSGKSGIEPYINAIEYDFSISPQIFRQDGSEFRQVNPDSSFQSIGLGSGASSSSLVSSMMSTDVFYKLPETEELYTGQYDIVAGRWPENYNELVLVLTSGGNISDFLTYTLGLQDAHELDDMIQQFVDGEDIDTPDDLGTYSYSDIIGITFKLVSAADYYEYDSQYEVWKEKTDNEEYMRSLVAGGEDLTIVGIVRPSEDATISMLSSGIYYPASLERHVAEMSEKSEIVKDQLANPRINVFTGDNFGIGDSENGIDMESLFSFDEEAFEEAFNFDISAFEDMFSEELNLFEEFEFDMDDLDLSELYDISDLDSLHISYPDIPEFDFSDLFSEISFDVSQLDPEELTADLLEGYQEYTAGDTSTDYAGWSTYFSEYLNTEDAQAVVSQWIQDNLYIGTAEDDENTEETEEEADDDSDNDSDDDSDEDEEVGVESVTADAVLSADMVQELFEDLLSGYSDYASQNGYPDLSGMGESFIEYLSTDSASELLRSELEDIFDIDTLTAQFSDAIQDYVIEVVVAYAQAIADALTDEIYSVAEDVVWDVASALYDSIEEAMESVFSDMTGRIESSLNGALAVDLDVIAEAFNVTLESDDLTELIVSISSSATATYEGNLSSLGYADFGKPTDISIYPVDFESKDRVVEILDDYNARMEAEGSEEKIITYTDTVGTLMSSVTDIVNMISYVLIAFVAISLVVSSIMIGVITYISVLERQKEIGILRAIGASKGNISQVFNAETGIIGLCAGTLGIILALLLTIPGNAIIHSLAESTKVNMVLRPQYGVALVILSVVLTLIGGLIPSASAARSDPVKALRTE